MDKSTPRIVSVSVVLTQIQPNDSSRAFSAGVTATRWAMSGAACTTAGLILVGHMGISMLASNTSQRQSTRRLEKSPDQTFGKGATTPTCRANRIREKGKSRFLRIMASRNSLRHFGLEFVLENGAVYTLEKLVQGVVLYAGSSPRRNRRSVWSTKLEESEDIFLSDLMKICQEENRIPYSFFGNNCKRFTWTALERMLPTNVLLEFERSLWPDRDSKQTSSPCFTRFRDTCQLLDLRKNKL